MDYVVGSVAALLSGNVTPNRPKLLRRALTPSKHQPSPDVTPKSEIVEDRSIFLSPTLQKKKAIIKKSPKRIFENPDLDITEEDTNKSLTSPKTEKVKKHLKTDLESDEMKIKSLKNKKSPKGQPQNQSVAAPPKKKTAIVEVTENNSQSANETTPTKKKKQKKSISEEDVVNEPEETLTQNSNTDTKSPSKAQKKRKSVSTSEDQKEPTTDNQFATDNGGSPKKKKRNRKNKQKAAEVENSETNPEVKTENITEVTDTTDNKSPNKKKRKNKKKKSNQNGTPAEPETLESRIKSLDDDSFEIPNPNAITNQDTDSEHESDDEIDSESEMNNRKVLNSNDNQESSDEEEEEPAKPPKKKPKETKNEGDKESPPMTEDEVKHTLFVGNVPMSLGVKKKLKRIFSQHGEIQTVRIRSIPVKDATATPKVAAIKNELHPDRTTVNVYIKYKEVESVQKALAENNTVFEECHLRVTTSDLNALDHDPSKAIFVGNLPFTVEDEQLREKFEKCGEIESVRIVRDRKTNAGKGFGFVNFKSKDGVELALALTDEDLTMKNRIIRVKRSGEKPPKRSNQGKFQKPDNFQNKPGNFQNKPRNFQNKPGNFQNKPGHFQNKPGNFQKRPGNFQNKPGQNKPSGKFHNKPNATENDGKIQNQKAAMKRLENKRKLQDNGSGDGPPREKKQKKEFVGVTAEKKKKRKFDKGQKKKKALSEILTK